MIRLSHQSTNASWSKCVTRRQIGVASPQVTKTKRDAVSSRRPFLVLISCLSLRLGHAVLFAS